MRRKQILPGVYAEASPKPPTPKKRTGLYVKGRFDNAGVRYQRQFLIALAQHAPQVFQRLEEIIPTIDRWPPSGRAARAIRSWAREFHLEPTGRPNWVLNWLLQATLRPLHQRWRGPRANEPLRDSPPGAWLRTHDRPQPFTFEFDGLEGFAAPWNEWEMDARKTFEQALNKYYARCHDRWRGEGYRLVRVTSSPTPVHLLWLVRYQVRGESFSAIARELEQEWAKRPQPWAKRRAPSEEPPDFRKTVAEAVKRAARLIRLRLRQPSKGGRRKKQQPSEGDAAGISATG